MACLATLLIRELLPPPHLHTTLVTYIPNPTPPPPTHLTPPPPRSIVSTERYSLTSFILFCRVHDLKLITTFINTFIQHSVQTEVHWLVVAYCLIQARSTVGRRVNQRLSLCWKIPVDFKRVKFPLRTRHALIMARLYLKGTYALHSICVQPYWSAFHGYW